MPTNTILECYCVMCDTVTSLCHAEIRSLGTRALELLLDDLGDPDAEALLNVMSQSGGVHRVGRLSGLAILARSVQRRNIEIINEI